MSPQSRKVFGRVLFSALCLALTSSIAAAADEWGNLKGRFVFDGKAPTPEALPVSKEPLCLQPPTVVDESLVVNDKGGLANVVVWVRGPKDLKINPDYEKAAKDTVTLDNKHCRFEPHVVAMRTSQPLEVKNSDPFAHNTNIAGVANSLPNQVIPANSSDTKAVALPEALPVGVTCNIHGWMKGWLLVRPDPYFAVSDKDGNFEIKNLPAGTELEFQVYHEKSGYVQKAKIDGKDPMWTRGRFKMTIKPGDNNLGEIKLEPTQFNKS
jgi:hypothetical protein